MEELGAPGARSSLGPTSSPFPDQCCYPGLLPLTPHCREVLEAPTPLQAVQSLLWLGLLTRKPCFLLNLQVQSTSPPPRKHFYSTSTARYDCESKSSESPLNSSSFEYICAQSVLHTSELLTVPSRVLGTF